MSALRPSDGGQLWVLASDYVVPPYHWFPEFGVTITPRDATLVMPAAGGTVLVRTFPDSPNGTTSRVAFYGIANYNANPAAFNSAIQICTPISSERAISSMDLSLRERRCLAIPMASPAVLHGYRAGA